MAQCLVYTLVWDWANFGADRQANCCTQRTIEASIHGVSIGDYISIMSALLIFIRYGECIQQRPDGVYHRPCYQEIQAPTKQVGLNDQGRQDFGGYGARGLE